MRSKILVIGGVVLVAVLSAGAGAARGAPVHVAAGIPEPLGAGRLVPGPCPRGTLPDGDTCVHFPDDDEGARDVESASKEHQDTRARWSIYDEIPRRPDRPEDYDAYRYPVLCVHQCVVSGYDLDRPDEAQRRGRHLSSVGHGAVDLPQKKGTPIAMVLLEHQQGDAEVVYAGPLFGTTIITRHALHEAGQLRDYLLLFGHMDSQAPEVYVGTRIKEGQILGFVGDSASPELVHLHLEVRRVRSGVDVAKLPPMSMIANENSVVCDPRNVLPLRPRL